MKNTFLIFLFFFLICALQSCSFFARKYEGLLDSLMYSRYKQFETVLDNPKRYEVQIIYTQINRDSLNRPSFNTFQYHVDKNRYFYPASMVKLPTALLALEKLDQLNIKGLTKDTPLRIDTARKPQTPVVKDLFVPDSIPTIGHYIHKAFVVSDNESFNRLYEFLGQKYLNESLLKKGYKDFRIVRRISGKFDYEDNLYTNPFVFGDKKKPIYKQKEQYNDRKIPSPNIALKKGIAYIDEQDKKVNKPMDFSNQNYLALETLHKMIVAIYFPETIPKEQIFKIKEEGYKFIWQCMSELPRESPYKVFQNKPDGYRKYLMYGNSNERIPSYVKIFNKVGQSYGFLVDCAYIVDFANKVEFLLSAVIYTNHDQVFNDDIYEYNDIGFPFMRNIGRLVYDYEKKRVKKNLPNLDKFKLNSK